jgi:hypothetical protein
MTDRQAELLRNVIAIALATVFFAGLLTLIVLVP